MPIFISVFESYVDLELKDLEIRMGNCRKDRQRGREEEGKQKGKEKGRKEGKKKGRRKSKQRKEKRVGQAEWSCCCHFVGGACALPPPGTSQLPFTNLGPSTSQLCC